MGADNEARFEGEREHPQVRSESSETGSSESSIELPRAESLKAPFPQRRSTDPMESVTVGNGKLTAKSPSGDVTIQLTDAQADEFVKKALHYQQAIIREKKANVFATYAMAALSGLSAVAVGATLIRSFSSKSKPPIT